MILCRSVCCSLLIALCCTCRLSDAADSAPLLEVQWDKLKEDGKLKAGEVIAGENGKPSHLKITNDLNGQAKFPLCELISPPIKTPSYAVRGKIKYQNVAGVGCLEMWNHFDPDGHYFSRTLGSEGPMQMISGTSAERDFILPFHTGGKTPAPKSLEINLLLSGSGTVEIGALELIAIESIPFTDEAGGWFDNTTAGLVGGVMGALIGIIGGVIGTLVGIGRGKAFVMGLAIAMLGLGLTIAAAGIFALTQHQPFRVYFVLLLLGGLNILVGALSLGIAPMRYRHEELRRMQALDA